MKILARRCDRAVSFSSGTSCSVTRDRVAVPGARGVEKLGGRLRRPNVALQPRQEDADADAFPSVEWMRICPPD